MPYNKGYKNSGEHNKHKTGKKGKYMEYETSIPNMPASTMGKHVKKYVPKSRDY